VVFKDEDSDIPNNASIAEKTGHDDKLKLGN
jgi:hypothetical protein